MPGQWRFCGPGGRAARCRLAPCPCPAIIRLSQERKSQGKGKGTGRGKGWEWALAVCSRSSRSIQFKDSTILMPQDWLLLSRIVSRDAEALADLYDVHSGAVYSLALRILRNQKSAEIVVQHTSVSVWEKAERYDPKVASVSTWLFAIARNLSIDEWRRESRPREVSLTEELPEAVDSSETEESPVEGDSRSATGDRPAGAVGDSGRTKASDLPCLL